MKTGPKIPPYSRDIWKVLRDDSSTIFQAISIIDRYERFKRWKNRVNHLLRIVGIKFQI